MASATSGESIPGLGARQAAVMALLWERPDEFVTVREVATVLDDDVAYTTVMTVLTRLHGKGFVERRRDGRAWAYRPAVSEREHTARAMTAAFHEAADRRGALLQFVEHLTAEEQEELRARLAVEDA